MLFINCVIKIIYLIILMSENTALNLVELLLLIKKMNILYKKHV